VVKRLLQLLGDQLALLDALSDPSDDAELLQALLATARARCQAWRKLAPEQVRLFVRAVIVRISVAQNSIVIALNKFALRSLLLPAVTPSAIATAQADEDDLIELSVEARVRRRGRSVHLVVSPLEANTTPVPENRALIELLAQGHRWLEQWLRGEVSSLRAIAKASGRRERHVSQVVRAAFLAPDLVEALLHGRQASQATLRQVMKHLPWDWREQRRQLGLPPDINDGLSVRDSVESTP